MIRAVLVLILLVALIGAVWRRVTFGRAWTYPYDIILIFAAVALGVVQCLA